jgi:ADP-ribose pyrophosphatase
VVSRRLIHKGKKFDFEMVSVKRPSGAVLEREIVRHPGAVVVVAVRDDGGLVLIRNFRISVEQRLLECCAGTLEAGEDPAVRAGRELIEETGYKADRMTSLGGGWFYTTPGLTDEKMYAFVATGLTHVGQNLEDDETIDVEVVAADEAIRMVECGEIRDGKTIAALLLAERRGLLRAGGRKGGG